MKRLLPFLFCLLTGCVSVSQPETASQFWSDSNLTAQVKTALLDTSVTDYAWVSVSTNEGVVTLSGTVGSERASELAYSTTAGIPGVKNVENHLRVDYSQD